MSTIQRVNFEPISDLLKTQIRDYALADKTIADPLNASPLWMASGSFSTPT
jgi:hypothetical protein